MFKKPFHSFVMVIIMLAPAAWGQTRDKGPWWPHPIWGPDDQAGGSNWITPEKILQAVALVKSGKTIELGHIYERGMPLVGNRSYNLFIPSFPTHGPMGENKVVYNDEFLAAEIGQVGTQFDGPGHVGQQITLANGTTTEVFYNGVTSEEMRSPYGLLKNGIENVKPIITRGIYIDIAGYKGLAALPDGTEVTLTDVRNALAKEGLKESDIEPGDALLFNLGWWRNWPNPKITQGRPPFISREVAEWIIVRKPSMIGSDATLDGPGSYVHTDITMKNGIFNLEAMNFAWMQTEKVYKFLFVFTPIRFKGATGSPGRPLAIF